MNKERARNILLRFRALDRFPKDEEVLSSLAEEMATAFHQDWEADEFAEGWIRTNRMCPKPADFYESHRQRITTQTAKSYHCTLCYDTGKRPWPYKVWYDNTDKARGKRHIKRLDQMIWKGFPVPCENGDPNLKRPDKKGEMVRVEQKPGNDGVYWFMEQCPHPKRAEDEYVRAVE